VNRGYIPGTLDKEGRLQEFTAACSPLFYRGVALPSEYYGNVFVCEPSGNLVKRNVVKEQGILLKAHDPHPGKEFLASTDERFRPVHLATGPDGAIYVADMYRGLVQHGLYVTPYLREQTIARKLAQPIHRGRIWRIVPRNWTPPKKPALSTASLEELVAKLSHPDGWYRDMAQRLLVERGDQQARQPLEALALNGASRLGRFHALWTLEGLKSLDASILLQLITDPDTLVRTTAVRLLEPLVRKNKITRTKFEEKLPGVLKDAPIEQILQISLSAYALDQAYSHPLLTHIAAAYDTSALIRDAVLSSLPDQEFVFLKNLWQSPSWQKVSAAHEIFLEMLSAAIVRKRQPAEIASMLNMVRGEGNSRGWKENAVLTGIAIQGKTMAKPIRLNSVPAVLTTMESKGEQSPLYALSMMFEWPGHVVDTSKAKQKNPLNGKEQQQFVSGRQLYLTTCAGCHGSDGRGMSRFAPPLAGSDWVLGDEKRLALILLHGMEGPLDVNGKHYDAPGILPVMPSHSTMDDNALSSILTYIRNEWGNSGGAISRRTVGMTRVTSQGRVVPWTSDELNTHIAETKAAAEK
jgi:mono/diheme cytochrome c family protein